MFKLFVFIDLYIELFSKLIKFILIEIGDIIIEFLIIFFIYCVDDFFLYHFSALDYLLGYDLVLVLFDFYGDVGKVG